MENNVINRGSGAGVPSNGMKWISWTYFVLGIWIIASPWILGYWRIAPLMWSQVVTGVIIALLSVWQLVGVEENHNHNNGQQNR